MVEPLAEVIPTSAVALLRRRRFIMASSNARKITNLQKQVSDLTKTVNTLGLAVQKLITVTDPQGATTVGLQQQPKQAEEYSLRNDLREVKGLIKSLGEIEVAKTEVKAEVAQKKFVPQAIERIISGITV